MKTKITVSAVIVFAAILLSSCANPEKINALAHDISVLHVKVTQLEQDINALRPEIAAAREAAEKANSGIDAYVQQSECFPSHRSFNAQAE